MAETVGSPHLRDAGPARLRLGLCLASIASFTVSAMAQETVEPYVAPTLPAFGPHPALLILRTLGSLALVLGLVVGVAWLARLRLGPGTAAPLKQRLRLLETLPLGGGRGLLLVALGERAILLGSSGEGLSCLLELPAGEVGFDPAEPVPESFLARLQTVRLEAVGR